MRKKIAKLLVRCAQWFHEPIALEFVSGAREMGICLHISKNDVKKWRKNNPDCPSHRKALAHLIEEAKWQVAGAIGRGMMKNDTIFFDVKKTPYVADVSGSVYVFPKNEDADE